MATKPTQSEASAGLAVQPVSGPEQLRNATANSRTQPQSTRAKTELRRRGPKKYQAASSPLGFEATVRLGGLLRRESRCNA